MWGGGQAICMKRGTSLLIEIPVRDGSCDGPPLDLSGAQAATFEVAASVRGGTVVITKTLSGGIEITADSSVPPLYTLNVTIDPSDTETAEPRDSYYYEASVIDAAGNVYEIADGQFEIGPTLTT